MCLRSLDKQLMPLIDLDVLIFFAIKRTCIASGHVFAQKDDIELTSLRQMTGSNKATLSYSVSELASYQQPRDTPGVKFG